MISFDYNEERKSFNKQFNIMQGIFWGVFILASCIIVISMVATVGVGVWAAKNVDQKGLKGVIERVWNGNTNIINNTTNN